MLNDFPAFRPDTDTDAAVIGAGAAGLATAIFARRLNPGLRVMLIDGARSPGAKILVSGGSRCNVTNATVTEHDYNGGKPSIIRRILRAFPVPDTVAFFRELGVPLHEEAGGKLFPDSNRSRDVLDALLGEARRTGVDLRVGHRVSDLSRRDGTFQIATSLGDITATRVAIATGGLSLPKTGSDGAGYAFARRFGHTIVPTTPALVPLVLDAQADDAHRRLSGVAHPVRLDLRVDGTVATRVNGPLLWTHFGLSGPAALDVSRHWLRARLDDRLAALSLSLAPAETFDALDRRWVDVVRAQPRGTAPLLVARLMPASVGAVVLERAGIDAVRPLADLTRDQRRALLHRVLEWPLAVLDSRGYTFAEVTAGGVALTEVDPATMASRRCPGLHFVGEVLDVDGRLGGFNFQWAWATARVAGGSLGRQPAAVSET